MGPLRGHPDDGLRRAYRRARRCHSLAVLGRGHQKGTGHHYRSTWLTGRANSTLSSRPGAVWSVWERVRRSDEIVRGGLELRGCLAGHTSAINEIRDLRSQLVGGILRCVRILLFERLVELVLRVGPFVRRAPLSHRTRSL